MSQTTKVNETIIKMVNDLRATGGKINNEDYKSSPLKRSYSSSNSLDSSIDDRYRTPLKKIKRDSTLNLTYVGSPRELRRLRADLVEARNTIIDLENRIKHMHSVRKQMQIMFDNETESLKRQHGYDRKTIEELENQLQIIRKRESELKKELSEVKENYDTLKLQAEDQITALQCEAESFRDESQTSALEENIESSKLKRKIEELETIVKAAQEDAEAQKMLACELGKRLAEQNSMGRELELKEVELHKAKNQIKILESAKEDYLEFQQQAKSQSYKLARYVELEKQNENLKQDYARIKGDIKNKLLLEEEVYDLRNRLVKHKELEKKVGELQAQDIQNQMYLNEFKAVARGFCETTENDAALPYLLRSALERLQQQELTLTSEKVEFESRLKSAEHTAKVAKMELEKSQKLISDLKTAGDQKQVLIHRMQKKLLLVRRERDSYRSQLDSYEKDLTIVENPGENTAGAAAVILNQKERIDHLEKVVEEYRDMVSKLEDDLQRAQPNLYSEVSVRHDQIARLQDDIAKLRKENEFLRAQKDRLEIQIESFMEGHDTLHGGQVIHLANNPLAECLNQRGQKVEQLLEENVKLKNKLKKMEEGIETSKIGDISVCPQEVQSLREQVKNNEKQIQKLKDCFKSSMQDFRNVIYVLFGYKIDKSLNSSIYKLRSMYAEHAEDQLCFEVNAEGDLNLLENEYSSNLGGMIELHLLQQKSIPVFLSALTIDLFSQKTMTVTNKLNI